MRKAILFSLCAIFAASALSAETEISLYGGWQTVQPSHVSGFHPDGGTYSDRFLWDGKSFTLPPYYGFRVTQWAGKFGTSLEFTHAKSYAQDSTRSSNNFQRFEFTDGLNLLTMNQFIRWPDSLVGLTPYAGVGLGLAFPHVDALSNGGYQTYGYQITGPAVKLTAGGYRALSETLIGFAEYQFSASQHSGTLTGGGSFETHLLTDALNVGIGWRF